VCGRSLIFRLNLPAIQLGELPDLSRAVVLAGAVHPNGEKLFRVAPLPLSLTQILAMVRADLPHAISTLWLAEVHAMSAWLLIGAPAIFLIYFLLSRALRRGRRFRVAKQYRWRSLIFRMLDWSH
jgi:hypothetical protein